MLFGIHQGYTLGLPFFIISSNEFYIYADDNTPYTYEAWFYQAIQNDFTKIIQMVLWQSDERQ